MRLTVMLVLVSGVVSFFASGRTWLKVVATREAPFGPQYLSVTGHHWFPVLTSLCIAAVVGAVLVFFTRGHARRVLGVLIVLIGAGMVVPGFVGRHAPKPFQIRDLIPEDIGGTAPAVGGHVVIGWPMAVLVSGLIIAMCGSMVFTQGPDWDDAVADRYETAPDGAGSDDPWRALDRGDDPTLDGK